MARIQQQLEAHGAQPPPMPMKAPRRTGRKSRASVFRYGRLAMAKGRQSRTRFQERCGVQNITIAGPSTSNPGQDLLQVFQEFGGIEYNSEFPHRPGHVLVIHFRAGLKQAFNIGEIAWPVRDGLHDDEVLGPGQGHLEACQVVIHSMGDGISFERERSDGDVCINPGGSMHYQKHT